MIQRYTLLLVPHYGQIFRLTHWGRDTLFAISQKIFKGYCDLNQISLNSVPSGLIYNATALV